MGILDSWSILSGNSSADAVRIFREYDEGAFSKADQSHYAMALMDTEQWVEARRIYELKYSEEEHDPSEAMLIDLGLAYWCGGDSEKALQCWDRACKADYVDMLGGLSAHLFVWYWGKRTRSPKVEARAEQSIRRYWNPKRIAPEWPSAGSVAGMVLGELEFDEVRTSWRSPIEDLESRRLCRIYIWRGVMLLDRPDAHEYFEFATKGPRSLVMLEPEYYLAKWELGQIAQFENPDVR